MTGPLPPDDGGAGPPAAPGPGSPRRRPAAAAARPADRTAALPFLLPPLLTLAWALSLTLTPFGTGPAAMPASMLPLVLPAALGGALLAGLLAFLAVKGKRQAIAFLLVLVMVGLSINLRQRSLGETALDWQNGLKLIVWLLLPLLALVHVRLLTPLLRDRAVQLALAFMAVAFLSSLWSATPAYSAANALGLAAYLSAALLAVARLGPATTLRLMLLSLALLVVLGLAAGVMLPERAWLAPSPEEQHFRLMGLAGHPNVFGEQAALMLTLAIIARRDCCLSPGALVVALALGFTALYLTGSRTTLAATLAAAAIVALHRRRLLPAALAVLLAGAALAILSLGLGLEPDPQVLVGALSRSGSPSEVLTLTGRTDLWAVAADLIARHPWFGWGYNGTEALIADSVGRGFEGTPVNLHNMVLQILLSLGLVGALPALALIGLLTLRFFTRPDPARDQILLLVLIIGIAEVSIFATPVLISLVFFFALARDAARLDPPAEADRP